MGTDIHFYVEENIDDKWVETKKVSYDSRNYNLFAILANVRNGYGFAGTQTSEGVVPISKAKGLPDNVSKNVKQKCDDWGNDCYGQSFFTVKELVDYNWNQITKRCGIVSKKEYDTWKNNGRKRLDYCYNWVSGDKKIVSNEEIELCHNDDNNEYYTKVWWEELYSEFVQDFYTDTLPALKRLADNKFSGDYLKVRVVFWFDN